MPAPGFSSKPEKKGESAAKHQQQRRDPYEVLGVSCNSTDQEIKSSYRRMALKYHPDKNQKDPIAADMFPEVTYSYSILSDPDKRRQYDTSGFEAIDSENQELELDLSSLGTVNTMFAAIFSKLGVPIKTTVSATVLEEALNGSVTVQFSLGILCVEKQCAHFYSVDVTENESKMGLVCRVHSRGRSKFKSDGEIVGDIISRIQVGWLKWRNASGLLCDRKVLPLKLMGKFYKMVVRPAMLYGLKCWPLKEKHNIMFSVAEMRMLRWMSGFTLKDMIQKDHIREKSAITLLLLRLAGEEEQNNDGNHHKVEGADYP
ncbi:hypothetical protein KFK09_006388 [Dendrobium nobile]|uniref:J domain-containing protein n=1 Tax=Dendrobium nobile TaxID=94219 RepID=A0A8T3BR71_DENNO|nr:hypothetical protein KFK09_006388 [Dendrobium nobile]